MSRAVPKEQKKLDTNSKSLLKITWKWIPCFENIWKTNRHAKSTDMMVSWVGIKIAYLVSQLTMTKIVSNLEDDGSFLIKSIEMEFYGHLEIESCLRDL